MPNIIKLFIFCLAGFTSILYPKECPGTTIPKIDIVFISTDSTSINVKDFGAKGNGQTDDAASMQMAIDYASKHPTKNKVIIPAGTYLVSPIFLKSNIILILSAHTILKATNHYNEGDRLLNIVSQSNIKIFGNNGIITMDRSHYTSGEQRFGLWMNNASNIQVYNLTCENCGGDGFCIGGLMAIPCRHILLVNCNANNNRRNGLSITNAIDVTISGGTYSNSHGTAPEFGIDLEPDSQYESLLNITIKGVTTQNNKGGGISIAPGNLTKGLGSKELITITIKNCKSIQDGKQGSILFANSGSAQKMLNGSIKITHLVVINPQGSAINYLRWNKPNKPTISLKNITVQNQGKISTLF